MDPMEYSPKCSYSEDMFSTGPCVPGSMGQLQNLLMGINGILCGSTETSYCEIFINYLGEGSKWKKSSVAIGIFIH